MFGKKLAVLGMSVMLAAFFAVPAFAHGHHSGRSYCTVTVEKNTAVSCPAHAGGDVACLVCAVDGCEETGHHLHDDVIYCGYPHEHGYCDGSCETVNETAPSNSSAPRVSTWNYRRHHGCH